MNLTKLSIVAVALAALPLVAQAQTIIFSDSFENDGTGYNLPDTSSNPPWNGAVTTYNGGPTDIVAGSISGQDGNNYLDIGLNGWNYPPGPPPAGSNTTTITTVDGYASFAANTTYTLTVLMQATQSSYLDGIISISDGTTSTVLNSYDINFGSAANANFNLYTVTFDTASNSSVDGDAVQIGLEASQSNAYEYGQAVNFDDVILTATSDSVPEPSTYALLLVGGLALLIRRQARTL